MGSKRTKKAKQDLDVLEKSPVKTENLPLEPEINNKPVDNGVIPTVAKTPKRKKKTDGSEVPMKIKKENGETKVKKKRMNESEEKEEQKSVITWPDDDLNELIVKMEGILPDEDSLAFRSRVEKLEWEKVTFKEYSPEECKKTWLLLQKRIRGYRLLKELLHDAKQWIITSKNPPPIPKTNDKILKMNKTSKTKRHPDMPRRPLTSYFLFYLNKKHEILNANPGLDGSNIAKVMSEMYKNLPPNVREKYDQEADANKKEYLEKRKIFYAKHPELIPPKRRNHKIDSEQTPKVKKLKDKTLGTPKVAKEKVKSDRKPGRPPKSANAVKTPKKCQTPFCLYFASELKSMETGADKAEFRLKCKIQYQQMSDKKKLHWIHLAEEDLVRYQEEVKAHKLTHPDYKPQLIRSILTKREKASKERAQGKPTKPPTSAYGLFSKVILQSAEIKDVHPKDRMNYCSNKWKNTPVEEQNQYKDQVGVLMDQYNKEYQSYFDTLPEEEKQRIIQLNKKKKRASGSRSRKSKKRKSTPLRKKPRAEKPAKPKFVEPEQPPISACKYFASLYTGDGDPVQAWKSLNSEEKRKYEEELVQKKKAYIVEFERFLKSLSKEELEAYSKSRHQQVNSDEDDDDYESSECASESENENEENEDDADSD